MSDRAIAKLLNVFVAALMVSSIIPMALVAGASAVPAALPPASPAGGYVPGDLNAVNVQDALATNPDSPDGALPDAAATATPPETPPVAVEQVKAGIAGFLVQNGAKAEDVGMPLLDFLEKYPQFKQQVAERTGIRALLAEHYDFTDTERTLILSRIQMSAYHSHQAPQIFRHGELLQAQGIRVPMATAPLLVIDDDGSENNDGPGDSNAALQFPFTNATELMTQSLTNKSIPFDLYVRPFNGALPTFNEISDHSQVIYVTGQNYQAIGGLTFNRRFQAYIDAEGDFWMLGALIPFALDGLLFGGDNATLPTLDTFMTDYMGIPSYVSTGSANPMVGIAGAFLAGQSYNLTRYIVNNITGFDPVMDFGYSMNYSATVSHGLTIGNSISCIGDTHSNAVGNLRTQFAGKGVVLTSLFEFSYLTNGAARDDFVQRMYVNLSGNSGFTWDAGTDIAPTDVSVAPSIDSWSGGNWGLYTAQSQLQGYYIFFNFFVERWVPATVSVTIDNFRNAVFNGDPKIVIEGDGFVVSSTRSENSTLMGSTAFAARSSTNITYTFTPHRMVASYFHVTATVTLADGDATNNELFAGAIGVAGLFDDAETLDPAMGVSGFTRVNSPAGALSGNFYWFTGSGNNLNNSLTLPWIDVRCMNSTTAPPDLGPCAARSQNLIFDFLQLVMWFNGSVTTPDALLVEVRADGNMTWRTAYTFSVSTGTPLQYTYYSNRFGAAGQPFIFGFGLQLPQVPGDQFLQVRLRYTTGAASASTGYKIDDVGVYAMTEVNNQPDFVPLFVNSIAPISPSYTVWRSGQAIASGRVGGTIDINETETVTVHAGIEDAQKDKFTYTWSQTVPGFSVLPANSTGYVYNANMTFNATTAYTSFEGICAANGATPAGCVAASANTVSIVLTATDELGVANTSTWLIRVRDALPVYAGPASFTLDEDSVMCVAGTGLSEWFSDPEGDAYTFFATSPVVNGSQTVTLSDSRAANGTICLRASSADWHGLSNITISATDIKGSIATIRINVTVLPVNDAPRFPVGEAARLNGTLGFRQNVFASINVTLFDVDNDQATLIPTVVSNPPNMWTEGRNATGNLWLYAVRPGNEMASNNYFNVTVCDPQGACSPLEFTIYILNTNDPPFWSSTAQPRFADQGVEFREHFMAADPDDLVPGESPTIFIWTDDTNLFEINSTGWVVFTPTNDQVGAQTVTLRVSDGTATAPLTFTMTVNNTNDPPVLPPYADINVSQDQVATPPLIKASDPDLALWNKLPAGQLEELAYSDDCPLFNIERVDQPSSFPGAPPEPAGRIRIQASNDQVGVWTCTVTVTDRGLLTDSLTFRIFVNNVNDSPTGVRINITDEGGVVRAVTVSDTKVTYDEDEALHMNVYADDPDLRFRMNEPTTSVNPTEVLTCSILSQFTSSLDVAPTSPAKPLFAGDTSTSDYDRVNGCEIDFTPTNNEVGLFTITVTIRDSSQTSITFKLKLAVLNINDYPTVRVVSPAASFTVDATGTLSLTGTAVDVDTAESGLTYAWTVEIVGGAKYTASQKSAQVALNNPDSGDKQVRVTLKVTDNLDPAVPLEVEQTVNGTIKGKITQPGFELPAVIVGMSLVAAVLVASRRRRQE